MRGFVEMNELHRPNHNVGFLHQPVNLIVVLDIQVNDLDTLTTMDQILSLLQHIAG